MTILKFFRYGTVDKIAWNDSPPVRQHKEGCEAMFQYAAQWNGLFISDKKLPGWLKGKIKADYFYGDFPARGNIVSGWLNRGACMVTGFNMEGKIHWRTGNEGYRFSQDDYTAWRVAKTKEEQDKILSKYPVVVAEVRKPRRKKELPATVEVVHVAIPF